MRLGLGILAATLLSSGAALAQVPPSQATVDPLQEQRRQEALEDRQRRVDQFQERRGPQETAAQPAGGPCFQVNKLHITGITKLRPKQIAKITGDKVPGCLQGADIQAIMRGLDAAYAERGYITAKTYIPPQNIASGELTFEVIEGSVEGLYLVDADGLNETGRGKAKLLTAFPGVDGKVLQLRKLEQGLDQMNRLASVEAKMRLQPGGTVGGSQVLIQRLQKDRFRGTVKLDNLGSESTGKNKLAIDLALDDALSLNDTWSFGYSGSARTNALSFGGSIPYGRATLSLNAGYSEYQVPLTALAELFGTTRSGGAELKVMAHRNQNSTTELKFALGVNKSDRYVSAARLTPQHLSTGLIGVSHIRQNGTVKHSFDLALKFGLRTFDADIDAAGIAKTTPHAQFKKLEGGWLRQESFGDWGALLQDLRFQFAPHALYSTEQMSLGSYSTVRGYESAAAVGDNAVNMRTDFHLGKKLWNPKARFLQDFKPFAFFDAGVTYDHAFGREQRAAGIGFGASYSRGRLKGSLLVGAPLIANNSFEVGDPIFTLRLETKLF